MGEAVAEARSSDLDRLQHPVALELTGQQLGVEVLAAIHAVRLKGSVCVGGVAD